MKLTIRGWPVTTPYGAIDADHMTPHHGIDLAAPMGTPVPAVSDGTITAVTNEGNHSFGMAVHEHLANGSDVIYGQLSKFTAHVGDKVQAGDVIGLVGSTGNSTGPHLHLQVMQHGMAVDPTTYVQSASVPKPGIGDHIITAIFHPLGDWISAHLGQLVLLLNTNSPEIITLAITICAVGMMVAPLMGDAPRKWFKRAMGCFWIGVIWRVIVT